MPCPGAMLRALRIAFCVAAFLVSSPVARAQDNEYWRSNEAYFRTDFNLVPHGNFFNLLPAVPQSVVEAMPEQDGAISWSRPILEHNKALYKAGHGMAKQQVDALMNQANIVFDTVEIHSVTNKPRAPKTGDKRTYWSVGPYFWPQPITPDNPTGEPYQRRDGIFNEALLELNPDNVWLRDTISGVKWLALAFFFSGERRFAEQARERVVTFFLDEKLGMLPNLDFAQSIPGVIDGRPQGTIDMRHIGDLLDGVRVLGDLAPDIWTGTDDAALQRWFTEYVDGWLLVAENARSERASENNHGNYYDVQLLAILKFLRRYDEALQVAYYARFRIQRQIVNGLQPYEFVRPVSVHYLTFNTKALSRMAVLCNTMGVDIWRNGLRHGFSLKDTWDFAVPHVATRVHYWPWKQINTEFDFDRFGEVLADVYRGMAPFNGTQGPYALISLNHDFWTSTDFLARFKGNFLKAYLAENLFRVEADSEYAIASLPEPECDDLACDSLSRAILIVAAVSLLACFACVAWNNVSYFIAERTPGLPHALRELAEQQKRILTKEDNLYIQQLAPKAYISPLFTREQVDAARASGVI